MTDDLTLRHGPLGRNCVHLCVDMQRMFAEDTDWRTPWMERVLPRVVALCEAAPDRTIFTRFIPAERPGQGEGTWRRYYESWQSMTLERMGADMVDLLPALARFQPPAEIVDKSAYSPWCEPDLDRRLRERGIDTLIVTGGETDVCVLGTVLGGVDRGYRVIVVIDALCSSSDEMHDAMLAVYRRRYGQQIETVLTETVIAEWTGDQPSK
ncbi:isochorismatase family cysteine hydrolase [Aureimonas sp. Leaf324]|jgi:nicotinamidase-related amidase|uniref:cysteine hydrolase family protein n=1 Tax=Aureimonas sp. Leaf324 TaxID=1736336 RepID=UPI0006F24EE6|nr:isochorismatase family cysteine hydrolase [Aureimonas sp. Leaf324]KQQ91320.1 cysteine hydrolase [Aureimonas sp. Leaf324]